MSNRVITAERFIRDHQDEAMRIVNQARLRREVTRGTGGLLGMMAAWKEVLGMGTRLTAVEWFVNEYRDKAMRIVDQDRLQREAAHAAGDEGQAGALSRVFDVLRRALNRPLHSGSGQPLQCEKAQQVRVPAEIRK